MRLTLTTPAADLPVSLEEAKRHCRVEADDTEDDQLLEGLIAAAVDYLDGPSGILGRAIITQTWLLELPSFPVKLDLPLEPVRSVTITYLDASGAEQTLPEGAYELNARPSQRTQLALVSGTQMPVLKDTSWPVRISIIAGFGGANACPPGLKVAIKMIVGLWYEHREAIMPVDVNSGWPAPVGALLARWRIPL
ncbi:hypothetical protein TM1040_1619 [Ruegeria sp. TM1040]|uniref:head-tail connector protein n=1 Tax=Ruegeria sp. (strain TM1040) TaxID=292414 RepID=UPI0000462396|nr:head-tail connector protein [Ruegeria sp. TM1040]ABF64352.1 hypothetical protein TM1040_1619 [Ruegeria sp. TM1040]